MEPSAPSTLEHPTQYIFGEEVFYLGASEEFASGNRIVHGGKGTVVGLAGCHPVRGRRVRVLFPGNEGVIICSPEDLSRAGPPPLPGGWCVNEEVIYLGTDHTFLNGDQVIHGRHGTVTGPAVSDAARGKGIKVLFPGNSGNVECLLYHLGSAVSSPLPGESSVPGKNCHWQSAPSSDCSLVFLCVCL